MSEEKEEILEEKMEEIEDVAKLKTELEETTDRYKRIFAEFENYKKRTAKERENLYGSLLADIIRTFLPVMDNLEKAAIAPTTDEEYRKGVELLMKQFADVFTSLGVKTIETVGKPFDPELHEAVSMVQDEKLGEKIVKEEFRKGYQIGSKVIRHAMVIVAN
ncbi:MAG: nucleotide exchange factor GrpE [Clostridia bacterium]|nr:nucleotide exchange factor GrpE [Clostridia bacterium]